SYAQTVGSDTGERGTPTVLLLKPSGNTFTPCAALEDTCLWMPPEVDDHLLATVGLVRPSPGEVLHFSEDPSITSFSPHVAPMAQRPQKYVWAVDHDRAPGYWFPRA